MKRPESFLTPTPWGREKVHCFMAGVWPRPLIKPGFRSLYHVTSTWPGVSSSREQISSARELVGPTPLRKESKEGICRNGSRLGGRGRWEEVEGLEVWAVDGRGWVSFKGLWQCSSRAGTWSASSVDRIHQGVGRWWKAVHWYYREFAARGGWGLRAAPLTAPYRAQNRAGTVDAPPYSRHCQNTIKMVMRKWKQILPGWPQSYWVWRPVFGQSRPPAARVAAPPGPGIALQAARTSVWTVLSDGE